MEYQLLICISSRTWTAMDVDADGICDRISMNGNVHMSVDSDRAVKEFYECILDYYNINELSEISIVVKIVVLGEYANKVLSLFELVKNANQVNIIDAKDILPIIGLKRGVIEQGCNISMECMSESYSICQNNQGILVCSRGMKEDSVEIESEEFALLYHLDWSDLILDVKEEEKIEEKYQKELESKEKKIAKKVKEYEALLGKYEELKSSFEKLQSSIDETEGFLRGKRQILKFSLEEMESPYAGKSFSKAVSLAVNNMVVGKTITEYRCCFMKSEGEVVKKNTGIVKVMKYIKAEDGEFFDTGYKSVIKAPTDGRVFLLVKENGLVEKNSAVAIISDISDTRSAVMKWYDEMK